MSDRKLLFSVTLDDCEVQTFRAGGPGGQKQNKTSSGVRIIHAPSGARGESREHRSQMQNKKAAFRRMVETQAFQTWLLVMRGKIRSDEQIEAEVDRELADPAKVRTEVKDSKGRWSVEEIVQS